MKIKHLNISAFGGVKNLDLDFSKPFNVVYGENENGKTTVMNFIKMMFYGTERSSAQLDKNPRKKYAPWDGSLMAGSIDFESDGRDYRLERIFGNSNSTDKVTLTDLGLGDRTVVAADIGVKFFGLTAAAFERSIFIGQFGFPESNSLAEGELNGKLSNITLTGDENISFDAVNKRLENAKYALMSKSGKSGIYDKNLKAVSEMENTLEKSLTANKTIENARQQALHHTEEIKTLTQKADVLKAKIDSENDFRNAEKYKELLKLKAQLDDLNQGLTLSDGTLADEMFVRKVEFCLSKIRGADVKIESKKNEITLIENNLKLALNPVSDATPEKAQELTQKIKSLEAEQAQTEDNISLLEDTSTKKASVVPFILAILCGIVGGVAFVWQTLAGIIGLVLAFIFICVGVISSIKAKTKNTKTQNEILNLKLKQNSLISVIANEKANLTAITAALNSNTAMIESQKELLQKSKDELSILESDKDKENDILFELFQSFKTADRIEEIENLLLDIKSAAAKQKELKQNINYILKDVGNISYKDAKEKLSSLKTDATLNFDELKAEYEALLNTITQHKTEVASILSEVKAISGNARNPESIKTELSALKKTTAAQKEYCDSLDIALAVLNDSYAEVRKNYGSVLEKKSGEIFTGVTGGKYKNISVSKSFDIAVEKSDVFGTKELDYLSSGTRDQAYLSLRLALSTLIGQELPVILDDALAQYDDKRCETALKFLNDYCENGQIILFTCHKSVVDLSKKYNANQITLN